MLSAMNAQNNPHCATFAHKLAKIAITAAQMQQLVNISDSWYLYVWIILHTISILWQLMGYLNRQPDN